MEDIIRPLLNKHRKAEFNCGNAILDRYFHTQASQDIKKQVCTCFVLANINNIVKGYYTLSNASVSREAIPYDIQKKLPRYTSLPVTILGRLAIDKNFQNQGLGELSLIDALMRSYKASLSVIGSVAVIVEPIDDAAIRFYTKYGLISLPDSKKMVIPMKTISDII